MLNFLIKEIRYVMFGKEESELPLFTHKIIAYIGSPIEPKIIKTNE